MGNPARADDPVIVWEPQPGPQTALVTCPVFEVFYGGARGGGKTDGMLGEFVSHAGQYGANAIGLMVRRTLTQLTETIERSRILYGPIGAKFNEQEKMWRFPDGARIRFAYLERDADADAYQGHSYTRVYIEELGTFPSPVPIFKLMATLRSGAGVPTGFRATGNPGGPGHLWVKARYIDPAPAGWNVIASTFDNPWTGERITRERVFIPAKLRDNRYLGTEYVANLQMAGSEQLVRAWLEGDWDIIEGAFFDGWRHDKHVIAPFEVPEEWLRFRSMDWGYASPFSVGWWAVCSDDYRNGSTHIPRGALVRYREWYGATGPNVGLRLTAEQVAQGVRSRDGSDKISYSVLDPSAFAQDGGPSIGERMFEAGVNFRRADNKRVAQQGALGGWDQMRARLNGDGTTPMIFCFSTCKDSIRTIPVLQHDPDKAEDLDTEQEDHAADDWRYACMSRPWIPKSKTPPEEGRDVHRLTMDEAWLLHEGKLATPFRRETRI
jgi:hypothetical protein